MKLLFFQQSKQVGVPNSIRKILTVWAIVTVFEDKTITQTRKFKQICNLLQTSATDYLTPRIATMSAAFSTSRFRLEIVVMPHLRFDDLVKEFPCLVIIFTYIEAINPIRLYRPDNLRALS